MQLDNTYEIRVNGRSVDLLEHYTGADKDGNPVPKTNRYHYGTVADALIGYTRKASADAIEAAETLPEFQEAYNSVILNIQRNEKTIKRLFSTEVRVAG